jgi:DNA polymerase-3 subunit delta'
MSFAGIIGQKRVCHILDRVIATGHYSSLLFVGQAGVGKRTVAIKFAQEINCENSPGAACGACPACRTIARLTHPDVRLIFPIRKPKDATPEGVIEAMANLTESYTLDNPQPPIPPNYQISIEAIRWLRKEMAKPPMTAKLRTFIILNAHQMTPEAQNALLKILEEPQLNTIFILTTDVPENLFATVRSRCHLIRFADISENEIKRWLENRLKPSQFPLSLIASLAQGSLGKAYAIATSPDDYFTPTIIQFLSRIPTGAAHTAAQDTILLNTADSLITEKVPLNTAINTAIFLLRNCLRSQLGYSPMGPEIPPNLMQLRPQEILAKLQFLSARLKETHLNTNATLTIFSLLYHLIAKEK